jgi:hypothetical protein
MKIKEESLEVFVVGLESVPDRDGWALNPKHKPNTPDEPRFTPALSLKPHLIEAFSLRFPK